VIQIGQTETWEFLKKKIRSKKWYSAKEIRKGMGDKTTKGSIETNLKKLRKRNYVLCEEKKVKGSPYIRFVYKYNPGKK